MEITDSNLQTLAGYLQQTLSPELTERRNAEKFLESVEGNQNYPLLLIHVMDKAGSPDHIRVSAAIMFKNYVKRNWKIDEDRGDRIHEVDRQAIKQTIVDLMLKSPDQIQKQVSDAISIVGREDFPDKWPGLIPEMVEKFASGDFHIINGVLQTAHSIFKRYRHEFKSNELWKEIKFVLDNFAPALTQLLNATMELAEKHSTDPVILKVVFSSLSLMAKVFYSLNFQDLPEYFEDNMAIWMGHFHTLLVTDNKLLQTQDEEEAGVMEQVKSQICDNVAMYAQKYDEEFAPHLPLFVTAVWNLLVSTGSQVKYDLLVSNAIQFLASVAERPNYKHLFEDQNILSSICEKVICPNMEFRAADEEAFEINPEEYIRRDMEGSDVDTRRRAACDLVKALCKSFEGPVISIFSTYVHTMLQEYAKNPQTNWKNKDIAVYLVTSLASKGSTQKHGVTEASSLVNLTEFFQNQIVPHLQAANVNEIPVLKAAAIKYVIVFRSQLHHDSLVLVIPFLVNLLTAESHVVLSYAGNALEKLFMLRQDGKGVIKKEDISPIADKLLQNLFGILDKEETSENEYIMKAIMRSFSILQECIMPIIGGLIVKLVHKLKAVSKNPSKPHFNHYLFEAICVSIRITCKADTSVVASFEDALFPPFQEILQNDVQEFMPYVFQILSLLLEMHTGTIPESYMALFQHLLQPVLWDRHANIPPLVRLLQAYISKGPQQIGADRISGLLGVFQKLLASKNNDHQGFYLLNSIVESFSKEQITQYVNQIFMLLFQRLQSSKTTKYIKSLLVFFCVYTIKYDPSTLIEIIDSIQPKMFGMVMERLFIADVQKVSGPLERKICTVGMSRILTEAPALLANYEAQWAPFLNALIGLFELPEDETIPDDEHFIEIEDTPGYQAAYSQLVFAGKKEKDICAHIPDSKVYLAKQLANLSAKLPGKISGLIQSGLEQQALLFLQNYMTAAGVTIS